MIVRIVRFFTDTLKHDPSCEGCQTHTGPELCGVNTKFGLGPWLVVGIYNCSLHLAAGGLQERRATFWFLKTCDDRTKGSKPGGTPRIMDLQASGLPRTVTIFLMICLAGGLVSLSV
jgi:hypothetical protein